MDERSVDERLRTELNTIQNAVNVYVRQTACKDLLEIIKKAKLALLTSKAKELVTVFVGVVRNNQEDAEFRALAMSCLKQLVTQKVEFGYIQREEIRPCLLNLLDEAVGCVENVKSDNFLKQLFSSSVHLLGARCDKLGLASAGDVAGKLVLLWNKAGSHNGSVSTRKEAAVCLVKLASSKEHREAMMSASSGWLTCVAEEVGRISDDRTWLLFKGALGKSSKPLCNSVADAGLFERHSVTSVLAFDVATLCMGEHFLDALTQEDENGRRSGLNKVLGLLERGSRKESDKLVQVWSLWSTGCAQSLRPELSPEQIASALSLVSADKSFDTEARAALEALKDTAGVWHKILSSAAVPLAVLSELDRVVTVFLTAAKNDAGLACEVWKELISPVCVGLPALVAASSSAVAGICGGWLFRGLLCCANKTFNSPDMGYVSDCLREFVRVFLCAVQELSSREQRCEALNTWSFGKEKKSLDHVRKIVAENSVNCEGTVNIVNLYKLLVDVAVTPTLRLVIDNYKIVDGESLSLEMSLVLLVLRCRSLSRGAPVSILADTALLLSQVEKAARPDFLLQLGRMCQAGKGENPLLHLRVWNVLAKSAWLRTQRDASCAAGLELLLSWLPLIALADSKECDIGAWKEALNEACKNWDLVAASCPDTVLAHENIAVALYSALDQSYTMLVHSPVRSPRHSAPHVAEAVAAMGKVVQSVCSAGQQTLSSVVTLSTSGDESRRLVLSGHLNFVRPAVYLSLHLHFLVVEKNKAFQNIIKQNMDIVCTAVGFLLVLPGMAEAWKLVLQSLRLLLDNWALDRPELLVAALKFVKQVLNTDPRAMLRPSDVSWLRECLESKFDSVHTPALRAWNDFIAAKMVPDEWDDNWKQTLQRLKDSKGSSSFVIPQGVTLEPPSATPESDVKRQRTASAQGASPSPSLHFEDSPKRESNPQSEAESALKRRKVLNQEEEQELSPTVPVTSPNHAHDQQEEEEQHQQKQHNRQNNHQDEQHANVLFSRTQVVDDDPSEVLSRLALQMSEQQLAHHFLFLADAMPGVLTDVLEGLLNRLPPRKLAELLARLFTKK